MKTVATIASACTMMLTLTGCDLIVRKAMETAIETVASAESDEDIDVDLRNGSINIRGDDGETAYAIGDGVRMPNNFPSELPQPDAKLITAFATGGNFSLTYQDPQKSEGPRIAEELVKAGFEETASFAFEGGQSYTFKNDAWQIHIMWGGGDGDVLSYSVSPASN